MKTAFIYALRCPVTGQIRYIGKATNPKKRLSVHLASKERCYRTNWVRSLTKQGLRPALEIIAEVPELEWQFWECSYIHLYRSLGFDLVNGTAGGDGGFNPSAEVREKMSEAAKSRSPEVRAKMSEAMRGKRHSEETRAKISESHRGLRHSSETCEKIAATRRGKSRSVETRAKISAFQRGKRLSPETRAKISTASKNFWRIKNGNRE